MLSDFGFYFDRKLTYELNSKYSLFPIEIFRKTDKILFQTEKLSRIGVLKCKFSSRKRRERKTHKKSLEK